MTELQKVCKEIIGATEQWVREAYPECESDSERLDIIKRFDLVQLRLASFNNDIIMARNMVDWICYHTPLPDKLVRWFEEVECTYE